MNDREKLLEEYSLELAISRELSKVSLHHFIQTFWHIVEPAKPFIDGWHIRAICDHLEACKDYQIKKLIICMPPRHAKSLICSVFFPAWLWASEETASRRFINATYAHELTVRDAIKMRDIVTHYDYKNMFIPTWQLKDDQNQKRRFGNTAGGFRFSTSVGGTMTGEGGDYIIIDDPLSAKLAQSELERAKVLDWWKTTMSTRANDPQKISRILIMQRLHENDLAGELIAEGDWDRLILPAEFDPKSKIISHTGLNWKDPRTKENELLWPQRFNREAIDSLKIDLGSQAANAQLQQNPSPGEGGLFKRFWWKHTDKTPSDIQEIAQFWDTAQKPGLTNDYSVCATWAKTTNSFVRLHLWRGKVGTPELEQLAVSLYEMWKPNTVVIEDKSSGSALIQYLLYNTTLPVIPFMPKFSKVVRATSVTPIVEAGKCLLMPLGIVNENGRAIDLDEEFLSEHEKFPMGAHDDMVDTTSMMGHYFQNRSTPKARRI